MQEEEKKVLARKNTNDTDFKRRTLWRSGCLECDKRAVLYFSQLFMSVLIVTFCVVMMVVNQNCETFSRFSPLLTFMLGIWFPQPQMREV